MWGKLALGLNSTLTLTNRKPCFTLLVCHEREKEHIIYLGLQKSKLQSYLKHQPLVSYHPPEYEQLPYGRIGDNQNHHG